MRSTFKFLLLACLSPLLAIAQIQPATGAASAAAQVESSSFSVPHYVRFSGTASTFANSTTSARFALYSEQDGGTPLWTETQNISVDASGHYSVLLGFSSKDGLPVDLFASGQARWLGITVNDAPEQPRVLFVSVPYALKAGDAETLGGQPLSSFVLTPEATAATGSGTVGTSTRKAQSKLQTAGAGSPATAAGTQNFVAKFDSTGTNLINSSLFDNGSVGIGTTAPTADLHIFRGNPSSLATLRISSWSPSYYTDIQQNASATGATVINQVNGLGTGKILFGQEGTAVLTIGDGTNSGKGNVGIGTTTPAADFHLYRAYPSSLATFRISSWSPSYYTDIQQLTSGAGATVINQVNGFGTGKILFRQEGSDVLSVGNGTSSGSGNVGIGTTVPNAALHLFRPSTLAALRISSYSASYYTDVKQDTSGAGATIINQSNGVGTGKILFQQEGSSVVAIGDGTSAGKGNVTVSGTIQSTSGGFKFPDSSVQGTAGVTNITVGTGLTGGGAPSSGSVSIGIDTTNTIQKRIINTCTTGQAIQTINADGSVVCVPISSVTLPNSFTVFGNSPTLTLAGYHYNNAYAELNGAAWEAAGSFPVANSSSFGYAVLNDKIYVFGIPDNGGNAKAVYQGTVSATSVTPTTVTWTLKTTAPMPTARSYPSAVAFGNYIYVFGGLSSGNAALTTCEVFDPNGNAGAGAWNPMGVTCPALPTAAFGMAATAIPQGSANAGIYLFGGAGSFTTTLTQAIYWDGSSPSFSTLTSLTSGTAKQYWTAAFTNGLIYLMGGDTATVSAGSTQNLAYNPVLNSYAAKMSLPDKNGRVFHTTAVSSSGQIYVVGDLTGTNTVFWSYDPASDSYTNFPTLLEGRTGAGSSVLSDGRLIVYGNVTPVDVFHPDRVLYEYVPTQ